MCDEKEMSIVNIMNQITHMEMNCASQSLKQYDLKPWQAAMFFSLHQNSGMSQRELAKKMKLTPSTITSGIKKMEKQGLIERRPDEQDQRIMRLYLTEKAENCLEQVWDVINKTEEMLVSGFSIEEKILLRRFLLQMLDNLKQHAECTTDQKNS